MGFGLHPANVASGSVTVPAAGTTSDGLFIAGASLIGLITPSALDSTGLTFEVSTDGSTWYPLYDRNGTQVSLSVTTGAAYSLDPEWLAPWEWIRIVCGTTETAARTFQLIGRAL